MKYSILGFNQDEVCNLSKSIIDKDGNYKVLVLDVVDLLIIQELADFMNRKKIIKHTIEDKTYFSIKYESIIEDLPIMRLKKQALRDRIDKMCALGVVEKYVVKNDTGSWTAFRLGDAYENLVYGGKSERGVCVPLHTRVYPTTHPCVADYTPNNYTTITNIQEEDTNVSPKKNDYKAIVDCWNKYNGVKLGKVTKLTEKRKKEIKKQLEDNGITQEQLMCFFKSLPFADGWLYNPNKQHSTWKPDFDWWMANTNGWLTKGLEGKVHKENYRYFELAMSGNDVERAYSPQGRTIWFNEDTKSYWSMDNFYDERIYDGYTDEDRPDGAEITLNNARGTIRWNRSTKKWDKK